MSISCEYDDDGDSDWYYNYPKDFTKLETKRGRKCCSCKVKLPVGSEVLELDRYRSPIWEIEESIYGDEVPLVPWFLCEECGGLFLSLKELGFCCDISHNIKSQIKEYREEEASYSVDLRKR